ncbi:response regulator [Bacillus sp. USDA818B3_A]|uniref:response regulator n=1 Tax=Bacillus sp. USDA818B3_A TaxID=2698834 RepID=UPI0013685236|nr:response regulator [Bacillus sp. USDA818B3_A]
MLKVLIADDEILERKVVAKIIKGSQEEVKVIGEAQNGRIAIEMAKEYRPDIIFMDIKMPGTDGVQAVKEIRKFDKGIRFIMVSAFNTFEYAKEVMQQGVKEYILKPSSKKDLLESLQRVTEEIKVERRQKEEHQSLRENLDRAVSIAQKEWVTSLLMNQVQDMTFDEWSQLLGVEITSGYTMLFTLRQSSKMEASPAEKEKWYKWLKTNLKTIAAKYEIMVGAMTDCQVPVLFLCKKFGEKNHFRTNAETMIDNLNRLYQQEDFLAEMRIGIGHPYNHAHELNYSYHEAIVALEELLATPNRKYLFFNKQGPAFEVPTDSEIIKVEKKLLDSIRQGDVNQVMLLFDSFVSKLGTNNTRASIVKKSFEELFILISRMLHDLGITYERIPNFDESDEIRILLEKGKTHLLAVVQHVQVWRNNHAKGMLQKAKDYIETHYAEAITLESAAEYVELSPFYFSKLFKDRFGMTFIDYLTEIRIKRAKAEMLDLGKSMKEICYSVGYRDPNYFSRVFKKLTGLSPSEFRKAAVK